MTRPGRFEPIDYGARPGPELGKQRGADREVTPAGVEIIPGNSPTAGPRPASRTARALDSLPVRGVTRELNKQAAKAPSSGKLTKAMAGAGAVASRSANPKVAVAGKALAWGATGIDVAAANGYDIPGMTKNGGKKVVGWVKSLPAPQRSLGKKVAGIFSRKGEKAIPGEGENAAGYAARMVSGEIDERHSAGAVPEATAGMDGFVERAQSMDAVIIDAEAVTKAGDGQRDAMVHGGGSGGRGGGPGPRTRRSPSTELELYRLEQEFDDLDAHHELSQGGAGAYDPEVAEVIYEAGYTPKKMLEPGFSDRQPDQQRDAPSASELDEETERADTVEFEPVAGPGAEHNTEMDPDEVIRRLQTERGDKPISHDDLRKSMRMMQQEAAEKLESTEKDDNPFSAENMDKAPSEGLKKMRGKHDAYAGMMVMGCLAPLRQGIDAESVAAVATTAAVMWALSPAFRDTVDGFTDKIGTMSDKKLEKTNDRARSGMAFKNEAQRKRVDKIVKENTNVHLAEKARMMGADENHVPRTVDSAAQQLVELNHNAYSAMREKEADPVQVMRKYAAMREGFEHECGVDGLDMTKVNSRARWLVGNVAQHDHSVLTKHAEISHGAYVTADPKEINLGTNGSTHRWPGSWVAQTDRSQVVSQEADFFTPRMPQSPDNHYASVNQMMSADIGATMMKFNGATKNEAMAELKDKLVGYSAGMGNQSHSLAGTYSTAAGAAGNMHSAIRAMKDDGLEDGMVRQIVDQNVSSTINQLVEHYPKEMAEFNKAYPSDEWVAEAGRFQSAPETYLAETGAVQTTPVPHDMVPIAEADLPDHERERVQARRRAREQQQEPMQAGSQSPEAGAESTGADQRGPGADRPSPVQPGMQQSSMPQNQSPSSATGPQGANPQLLDRVEGQDEAPSGRSGKQRDYAQEQRDSQQQEQQQAQVDAAERQRQAEASAGHAGRTTTPAQEAEAATYNNDYSTSAGDKVDLNFNDSTTEVQEDQRNRHRRHRAVRNLRVQNNQGMIAEEQARKDAEAAAQEAAREKERGNSSFVPQKVGSGKSAGHEGISL